MAHIRRIGLYASGITLATLLAAAFIAEGIGLAVIVAVAGLVVMAFVIPVLIVFEEERDLPSAQARRRWH